MVYCGHDCIQQIAAHPSLKLYCGLKTISSDMKHSMRNAKRQPPRLFSSFQPHNDNVHANTHTRHDEFQQQCLP